MDEMRMEMESLTRFEKRKGALSEIEDVFENLSSFIGKLGNEQKRTVITLKKLDALMQADRGTVKYLMIIIIVNLKISGSAK